VLSQAADKNTLHTLHSTCLAGISLGTHYDTGNTDNVAYGENLRVNSFTYEGPHTTAYSKRVQAQTCVGLRVCSRCRLLLLISTQIHIWGGVFLVNL